MRIGRQQEIVLAEGLDMETVSRRGSKCREQTVKGRLDHFASIGVARDAHELRARQPEGHILDQDIVCAHHPHHELWIGRRDQVDNAAQRGRRALAIVFEHAVLDHDLARRRGALASDNRVGLGAEGWQRRNKGQEGQEAEAGGKEDHRG